MVAASANKGSEKCERRDMVFPRLLGLMPAGLLRGA
jgi:hypothetical protein